MDTHYTAFELGQGRGDEPTDPISLKERIKARQTHKQPEWIRRMQEGKLPAKDLTEAAR